jgi:hypothetical protein
MMFKKSGSALLRMFGVTDKMVKRSKVQKRGKRVEMDRRFLHPYQREGHSKDGYIGEKTEGRGEYAISKNAFKFDSIKEQKISDNVKLLLSKIDFRNNKYGKEEILMKAGDDAEISLRNEILKHENFCGCKIWTNKRVKKYLGDTGPNEIDIIVLSPNKLYAFECKNISGTLMKNPNEFDQKNRWVYIKVAHANNKALNNDTNMMLSEDIAERNKLKIKKLQKYLLDKEVAIPNKCFENKVVFMNRNFKIKDDHTKSFSDDIITYRNLQTYLEKQGISDYKQLVSALVAMCLEHESENGAFPVNTFSNRLNDNSEIIRAINDLPSWDYICLYGGGKQRCDIRYLKGIFLNPPSEEILNNIGKIKVIAPRSVNEVDQNRCCEMLKLNLYDKGGKYVMRCDGDYIKNTALSYHPAGKPRVEHKFLYEIEEILLNGLYRSEEDH